MIIYQVDVLNPKATQLLQDLADMNLIAIKQMDSDGFGQVIERLRLKAEQLGVPTMEEVTQEVEVVRVERYARNKDFDTVKNFREIKDKICDDIKEMTFEQLQVYLDKTKLKPQNTDG